MEKRYGEIEVKYSLWTKDKKANDKKMPNYLLVVELIRNKHKETIFIPLKERKEALSYYRLINYLIKKAITKKAKGGDNNGNQKGNKELKKL